MKSRITQRKLKVLTPFVGVVAIGLIAFAMTTSVFAAGGVGSGSTPGSGGSGGHYTDNAFGWHLFDATPGQPGLVDSMSTGSWGDVYNACKDVGQVWMYLIFNTSGTGKEYSLAYSADGKNHPEFFEVGPGNRIYYNGAGSTGAYYNAHYNGDASENTVHGYFNQAVNDGLINPGGLSYGTDVGWFCWNNNPPWNITANTTVSVNGSASSSGQFTAEVGDKLQWTHSVSVNSGSHNTNQDVHYTGNNSQGLTGLNGGSGTLGHPAGAGASSSTNSDVYSVGSADFGKNLCRYTSATPSTNTGGTTNSGEACVKIVKKPKVQVYGGDVSAGRAINGSGSATSVILTSQTVSGGTTFGSFGEYALTATGSIYGAASGAAFYQNGLAGASGPCDYNKLTITNSGNGSSCTTSSIGNYSNLGSIPDIGAQFAVQAATTPTFKSGDLSDAQYNRVEQASGNITITGGTIQGGQWLVINAPSANVTITGNITYATKKTDGTAFKGVSDLPQLVIIANSISIDQGVSEVDAWLVASGSTGAIHTCTQGAGQKLSATMCNNALNVYGPVMAKHLYLERTAGAAGATAGDKAFNNPAETFHLRSDAYLWGAARSLEGLHVSVSATSELPPRF
jgi:hypothetical protein